MEHRNKYNINKQDNENQFSLTMSNGFYEGNKNINIRNINSNLNFNEIKKLKQRKNIKSNNINKINKINSKDMKKDAIPTSFIKKDNNLKMAKETNNKRLNKSIINNRSNKNNNIANVNNINKKQYNVQTHKVKLKPLLLIQKMIVIYQLKGLIIIKRTKKL